MANKFLALTSTLPLLLLLSPAWAGIIAQPSLSYVGDEHAVAHTQQNVVRSYDGTVSHYAKSVATPYSQVHKQDTRISNNVYQPAIAKTVTYAAPAAVPVQYTHQHQQPAAVYSHSAPAAVYSHSAPSAVYSHSAPAAVYSHSAPAAVYSHSAPAAVYSHSTPVAAPVYHQPQQHIPSSPVTYASHQPQAVIHYSPAETVSHMSFDGFGTHWGF